MTRWLHPPERERHRALDRFDPVTESERDGLPREFALAIWEHVCADATDGAGQRDEQQARQRFHAIAARVAARGGQLRPAVVRLTRVGVEHDRALPGTSTSWPLPRSAARP